MIRSTVGLPIPSWAEISVIVTVAGTVLGALYKLTKRVLRYLDERRASRALSLELPPEDYSRARLEQDMKYYVEPACGTIDPSGRDDLQSVQPYSQPLFETLDNALYNRTKKFYLLILGDSGMGKTTALVNYAGRNLRRKNGRIPIVMVFLTRPGALERIAKVAEKEKKILFLDAFDEDAEAIRDHKARAAALVEASKDFKGVVMSCRSQFYVTDEEIISDTGLTYTGPRSLVDSGKHEFEKIYLQPFSEDKVKEFLRLRYPAWRLGQRRRAAKTIHQLRDLSARPMLLAYIEDMVRGKPDLKYLADAYDRIVEGWFRRESVFVKDTASLRNFSKKIAMDLFVKSASRGGEHIPAHEILPLARAWNIPLEEWELRGRSLLNRSSDGHYRFAHRSFLEYLFVRACLDGQHECLWVSWTDQMHTFAFEILQSEFSDMKPDHLFRVLERAFSYAKNTHDAECAADIVLTQLMKVAQLQKIPSWVFPESRSEGNRSDCTKLFLLFAHIYVHREGANSRSSRLFRLGYQDSATFLNKWSRSGGRNESLPRINRMIVAGKQAYEPRRLKLLQLKRRYESQFRHVLGNPSPKARFTTRDGATITTQVSMEGIRTVYFETEVPPDRESRVNQLPLDIISSTWYGDWAL